MARGDGKRQGVELGDAPSVDTSVDAASTSACATRLVERNQVCEEFFLREARGLAEISCAMAERFLLGGRLLAFGRTLFYGRPTRVGGIRASGDRWQTRVACA
jgi:hypothetical protein